MAAIKSRKVTENIAHLKVGELKSIYLFVLKGLQFS
jgi:hypothetical protein